MRRFIISALVLSAVTANAQVKNGMVGINTDEPRVTMHIEPGVSESKGLIIPRITAAQMKTMTSLAHFGADHHAIITYLKETLPLADRTGKLVDVAEPGYYYYDNTTGVQKWKTFGGGAEQDLRMVGTNHLTKEAGVGFNGSNMGTGGFNIGIGAVTYNLANNNTSMSGGGNIALGRLIYTAPNTGTMSGSENTAIGRQLFQMSPSGGSIEGRGNVAMGESIYILSKANAKISNSAQYNTGIGQSIFTLQNGDFTGQENVGIGQELYSMQSGDMVGNNNIGMGKRIYIFNKTAGAVFIGSNNTGIGDSIFNLTDGDFTGGNNIGLGIDQYHLVSGNMAGGYNVSIGYNSYYVQNGNMTNIASNNIALGRGIYNLFNPTTSTFSGYNNIGIGDTLYNISSGNLAGNNNIGIGNNAYNLSSGDMTNSASNNIALGNSVFHLASNSNATFSGEGNIGIGYRAFQRMGSGGTNAVLSGNYNMGMGNSALGSNVGGLTGDDNIAFGFQAMYSNWGDVSGSSNIALGRRALYSNWDGYAGSNNIGIGEQALYNGSGNTGDKNIAIGYYAGSNLGHGNGNVFLGNSTLGSDTAGVLDNVVSIGHGISPSSSNSADNVILLGNNDTTNAPKIGMGTYKPQSKLDVNGEVRVGNESGACTYDNRGAIRFDGSNFYGCNGSTWKQLDN